VNIHRIFIDPSVDIKRLISGANVIGGPARCPRYKSKCVSLKEFNSFKNLNEPLVKLYFTTFQN
jgi:hypothetical protein